MKKKIIIAVVVIVALIIGVLGYMVISDMGQEDKLKTELSEINDLANAETIDMDEINKRLDRTVTTGDYAKVEEAFKSYLRDSFNNSIEIADLINDERITTLLTEEEQQNLLATREKLEQRLLEEYGDNASFEIYFADGNKSEYEDGKKVEE